MDPEKFFLKMKKRAALKYNEIQRTKPTLVHKQSNNLISVKRPEKVSVDSFGNFIKKD